jgi:DNA-binding transcriptional ArsR family regulator
MGNETGTGTSRPEPFEQDAVMLDPHNLRGLAHPLRVRLLGLLRSDGSSTATRLAERLGQSSGATSYHLRQLAA